MLDPGSLGVAANDLSPDGTLGLEDGSIAVSGSDLVPATMGSTPRRTVDAFGGGRTAAGSGSGRTATALGSARRIRAA